MITLVLNEDLTGSTVDRTIHCNSGQRGILSWKVYTTTYIYNYLASSLDAIVYPESFNYGAGSE